MPSPHAEFFPLFRTHVLSGRTFTASEDRPGGPLVAVLSHVLWTRRFHNDPTVLGRRVSLGNVPYVIVGILPSEFDTEQFDPQPVGAVSHRVSHVHAESTPVGASLVDGYRPP